MESRWYSIRNNILNGIDNTIYNVYSQIKSAKELWEYLKNIYKTKDIGSKKFIMDYKMVDPKFVVSQV